MEQLADIVFAASRWIHIVVGFAGLAAFWVPVVARKGGRTHVRFGRVFELSAYVIGGTALLNTLGRLAVWSWNGSPLQDNREIAGFLVFLAYLAVVTVASVRQGVRAVGGKGDYGALHTPLHLALAVASVAGSVCVVAFSLYVWSRVSIVLLALSPIGFVQGYEIIRYVERRGHERMGWWYEHMGAMLGAGIAFHTAFLVFGSQRLFDYRLGGALNFLPWVLPAAVGIPAIAIWQRHYRRKFGDEGVERQGVRGKEGAGA